ncbi:hypothetical protein CD149_06165 [Staphylococcus condimenti]|uniref:Uncharacterized protein n=1 Tax=Staphylococcus condimenti TaxID=70255 RepID=A0A4Q7CNU7_9STAP|nr:hypothetical protein BTZ13_08900 [Staphylococcus condimenti]PNZ61036.1 hypothetical protein CD149_06165 [Staphylococcus condimenti]POA06908.1 hypothetical protein CD153_01700 [Staphylococcus carnosus]RZI03431.1 hypothetical protein EIG99_03665 [Staphylococcus condimenti]RZI03939.1 hypothetical protein EIG98_05790 [Staphylococcus condimenti]
MRTTFIFSSFRCSSFWNCHDLILLKIQTQNLCYCLENNDYNTLYCTSNSIAFHHKIVVIFEALDRLS